MKGEAIILGKYLLGGETPDDKSVALFLNAAQHIDLVVPKSEQKAYLFAMDHPLFLGAIDSALAFGSGNHILRRKILLMSAILESRPRYASLFLTQQRSPFYFFVFLWVGFRALCKAVVGKVILLFLR
jgi:hypothetical protein